MNNANGALQVGASQDDDTRHMGVCRVSNNCRWERYHSTRRSRDRPRPGRLKTTISVFRHRFGVATSTASQIPGLRRISFQTVIDCLRQAR